MALKKETEEMKKNVTQVGGCPATGKTAWLTKSSYKIIYST